MTLSVNGPVFKLAGIGKFAPQISEDGGRKLFTGFNIAGYFPLVGLITGIFRIKFGAQAHNESGQVAAVKLAAKVFIVRGIMECLGLGILCAPVDIGCSLARLVREHRDAR
jgi:hypothetical protein